MADIVLIGATGGIGSRLIPMLIRRGHSVTGLHRKDEQARELKDAGATPAKGDLMRMSADDFAAIIKGADAVVFSAGAAGSGARGNCAAIVSGANRGRREEPLRAQLTKISARLLLHGVVVGVLVVFVEQQLSA